MTTTTAIAKLGRYEDLELGTKLPEHSQLLNIPMMMRWCGATEELRRDHYDDRYAIEHDNIPGGSVLSGSHVAAWLYGLMFDLVAPEGWVYKSMHQNKATVHPGSTLTFFGVVTNKYEKNGLGYVEVDMGFRVDDGSVPIPGKATLVLPLAGGRPVPYPFVP